MGDTALAVLKYLGFVVAVVSGIWALLHRPTSDEASGRRRVTRAGLVSIAFIVIGGVIGAASTYYESQRAEQARRDENQRAEQARRDAEQARRDAERAEARRAPLRHLAIDWTFSPTASGAHPPRAGGPAPTCKNDYERLRGGPRLTDLYPWLAAYPGGSLRVQDVIVLLPLDANHARILPLGLLQVKRQKDEDALPTRLTTDHLLPISATVEFREDLQQCLDNNDPYTPFAVVRPRRCPLKAALKRDNDRVTAAWDLDAACIATGVDRTDAASEPTAEFPDSMTVVVLTDITGLPFAPRNFALSEERWLPWDRLRRGRTRAESSTLTLVANGRTADAVTYQLWLQGTELMGGKSAGAEVRHDFPSMKIWTGARAPKP